jgi:hypothetical protein
VLLSWEPLWAVEAWGVLRTFDMVIPDAIDVSLDGATPVVVKVSAGMDDGTRSGKSFSLSLTPYKSAFSSEEGFERDILSFGMAPLMSAGCRVAAAFRRNGTAVGADGATLLRFGRGMMKYSIFALQ